MKNVILLVCFGNNNIDNQLTLFSSLLKKSFPDYHIQTCFTSNFFAKKYNNNVETIMDFLTKKKCENLICVPLFIINGVEYKKSISIIKMYIDNFKYLKICNPLLHEYNDFYYIQNFILNYCKNPTLYICHGSDDLANNSFYKLFSSLRHKNIYFANLENNPYIEDVINDIKHFQSLTLKPFLLFEGKHIKNDIAGSENSILTLLKNNNINVTLNLTPLMQYEEILLLFKKHILN